MVSLWAGRTHHAAAALPRVLLALCAAAALVFSSANAIGVNFGQVANDLPSADVVLTLVQTTSITKVKLYGADPAFLTAVAGTGIEVVIGAGNDQIEPLANTPDAATQWVQTNIVAYPNTSIVAVSLGNEVLSYSQELMPLLLPALQNLHAALVTVGLDQKVKLSTPHSLGIVSKSFPPSFGEFHYLHGQILGPLLDFFTQTGAPFMVNAYPYFAYAANPGNISLDYVLFEPNATPVLDTGSGLNYTNMFDAQVDAVYAAIAKLGYNNVTISVTETGWPSAGDPTETAATIANAQLYNSNLIKRIQSGVGTPARPDQPVETYIFALYNEDMKPGPASERNFGLFIADGTPIYDTGLTASPGWLTSPPPPPPYVSAYPPPPASILSPPPTAVAPMTPPPPPSFFSPPPASILIPPPPMLSPPPPEIATPPAVGLVPPCPPPPPVVLIPPPVSPSPTSSPVPPTTPGAPSWCVAKPDADAGQLQIALDWACSDGGADCSLIQPDATCYLPNTVYDHASYAFNNYYQLNNRNYWNCFFSDTGLITNVDPSYVGCTYG